MADSKLSLLAELAAEMSDSDEIYVNDGGVSKRQKYSTLKGSFATAAQGTLADSAVQDFTKAIIIESPTATEDASFYFTDAAITLTKMRAVLVGSSTPSVTWTVRHGTDRAATGAEVVTGGTVTTSITTGSDITAFNDATIIANSWLWIETTAQSGTVGSIIITIFYDED